MDRQSIATTALELLDETGLDGLTVRRLATRLNVQSPALYWHFRDKQDLLDEMARLLQSRQDWGLPREGERWRDWLARRTRERRQVLLSRRDGARLVTGTHPGPEIMASFDGELGVLVRQGFTPVQAIRAITSLGYFVTGFVLAEQAERLSGETSQRQAQSSDYDQMARSASNLFAAIRDGGDPGGEAAFEDGLHILIDGVAVGLEHR